MASFESLLADAPGGPAAGVLADAARSKRAGRVRLEALARDLFGDDAVRVDEAQRTRIRALLTTVTRTIEGRIRRDLLVRLAGVLPAHILMVLGNMTVRVARIALDADGPVDPDLVAVLARRVDEHRLVTQAHIAVTQDPLLVDAPVLDGLTRHGDAGVAGAARALVERDAARRGRFDEPVLVPEDLPIDVCARLHWRIAAAIRHWIDRQDVMMTGAIDRAVAAATGSALSGAAAVPDHDAVAIMLARAMLRTGIADDAGTVAFAVEGHVAAAVAGLALRAGIGMAAAWDMVLDPDGARLVVLLRAAAIDRSAAAALMLRWPDGAAPIDAIVDRMAGYDALSDAAAQDAIDLYRLDPDYVAALDAGPQARGR
ncbi:DUF2336 domain-containing protein [Sphingomonas montana]|uniref:DUF2336 domain-containing protein n=1 Tax=Sphingomonas montana TaxID=1843236 RepID=UPI00096FE71B|nr:DUF2336 domain-containing protein [Sphingomonas montana]